MENSVPEPTVDTANVGKVLRALFWKLLLRGRVPSGTANRSAFLLVLSRFGFALLISVVTGASAGIFLVEGESQYSLSTFLHGLTLLTLGVLSFRGGSSTLLAIDDADILLHRPIPPRELLRAKVAVLVQVSLVVAIAVNLVGLYVGVSRTGGSWGFLAAHLLSTALAVLFFNGVLLLICQRSLSWFGRFRGDSVGVSVLLGVALFIGFLSIFVVGPQRSALGIAIGRGGSWFAETASWRHGLLPPLWFAAIDDALTGTGSRDAWLLSGIGLAATALILWAALWRYADGFQRRLQEWIEARQVVRVRASEAAGYRV